jgi:hypothetical protein
LSKCQVQLEGEITSYVLAKPEEATCNSVCISKKMDKEGEKIYKNKLERDTMWIRSCRVISDTRPSTKNSPQNYGFHATQAAMAPRESMSRIERFRVNSDKSQQGSDIPLNSGEMAISTIPLWTPIRNSRALALVVIVGICGADLSLGPEHRLAAAHD